MRGLRTVIDLRGLAIFLSLWMVLLLSGSKVVAQRFTFKKYMVDQGLSENTVQVIMQDNHGFMWFGTKDGLNRFDGHQYRIFKNNPQDDNSIGNNFIRALYQDNNGIIWVGTDSKLFLMDPITETFKPFKKATTKGVSIHSAVTAVCPDYENQIWIGTMTQGVFVYNITDDSLTQYSQSGADKSLKSDLVWRIFRDFSGTIWIGTRGGLSRYNKETGAFLTYEAKGETGELIDSEILSIFEDSDGEIWLGTWSGGLSKLNKTTNSFKTWFGPSNDTYITHIRVIFEYEKNQLLIGSDDGLYLFNKLTQTYRRIDDTRVANSLSDQNVYSIFKDREGGIWVGTYFGGVNYFSPIGNFMEHYYPNHSPNSMSGKAVSQFCEDEKGNLWVATEDGGLNYFNTKTRQFKVFLPQEGIQSLSYHNIHSLLLDNDNLWIGTFSRGIDVLNLKTQTFRNYQHNVNDENSIDDNCVFSIYKNSNGEIFVGTPYGLNRYNRKNDNFTRIPEIQTFVYDMQEDHLGDLWLASYGDGIFRYNSQENNWRNYRHDPTNPNSISFNKVSDVYLDDSQRLWFATEGRGIFKYNYESDDFYSISEAQGLPNNVAYGILDDKYGNIWVSTNKGISKINLSTLEIKTYTKEDGLQSDQFNYRSSFKASDGTFYFGGINGFNVFNPDNLKDNSYLPPVLITNIEFFDEDYSLKHVESLYLKFVRNKQIILKHNQASFRISFVALSFLAQEKNQFSYILETQNSKWIPAGNQRSVSYINLPPGKYTFRVKGSNNDGVWNYTGDYVEIVILPPLWKSIYAYMLYAFFGLLILFYFVRLYSQIAKKKQKLKLEAFQKVKEKEMYDSKINFFTNIAHEIRTPVSLIKAPLECILNSEERGAETLENLQVIERNTDRLLDLVNQLLDFRKIEDNIYRMDFSQTDVSQLLKDIFYRFNPAAERRNISLQSNMPKEKINVLIDKEAVIKIISNLLTNALKYASSRIIVTLRESVASGFFEIAVADDGPGIENKFRDKVFEPFYQIEGDSDVGKKAGTGIGLALAKQLAERHNGFIHIDEPDSLPGALFVVRIPLTQTMIDDTGNQKELHVFDLEKQGLESGSSANEVNLLIVEDNAELRSFLERNLKQEFNILTAENGAAAIDILNGNVVEIIISDIVMPVIGGLELVKTIKEDEQHCHIPIVLLSARTNVETKIRGMECGADCYIEKPFSVEFLKAQINSLLRNRMRIQEKFAKSPFIPYGSIANNKKDEDFIYKLNNEIEKNLADAEYSIEKLSIALSVSRSNLQRKIKGLAGMTPNDYIRVFRLKKSAQLLLNGEYRINEICYLVGFNSPSYFSKCFQKQFGALPKEFVKSIEHE